MAAVLRVLRGIYSSAAGEPLPFLALQLPSCQRLMPYACGCVRCFSLRFHCLSLPFAARSLPSRADRQRISRQRRVCAAMPATRSTSVGCGRCRCVTACYSRTPPLLTLAGGHVNISTGGCQQDQQHQPSVACHRCTCECGLCEVLGLSCCCECTVSSVSVGDMRTRLTQRCCDRRSR